MTLSIQFVTIISMIAGGVYLGAAIDTFHRFETYWKKRVIFSYFIEICFWLLQTLVLFYVLYLVNQGELRFYILLALICGYAAYKSLFEQLYQRSLERIIIISISIGRFTYRTIQILIIKPIKRIIQLTTLFLLWIYGALIWLLFLLFKIIFYPLRFIFGLIWRLVPQNAKKYVYHLAGFYSKIKNKIKKWWEYILSRRG